MLEKRVESILVAGIKKLGGKAYKFTSPGNAGVPDRLVVLPGGKIHFVELKTESGKLSPLQANTCLQLSRLGCEVHVLYGAQEVRDFLHDLETLGLSGTREEVDT